MTNPTKSTNQSKLDVKRLLALEVFICITAIAVLFALIFFAALVPMTDWQKVVLILIGLVPFLASMFYATRIEQVAGLYQCAKCKHRYVPSYGSVFWAFHFGRTRYMKCPKCNQRSWQKKKLA